MVFQKGIFSKHTGLVAVALAFAAGSCLAQNFVHPPSALTAADFAAPPSNVAERAIGPAIAAARSASCWYAEPNDPQTFIGGSHEVQKVQIFIPISVDGGREIDADFHQSSVGTLSGGGRNTSLKPQNIPPGIFVSVNGHPIYEVTSISFPTTDPLAMFTGQRKKGVLLEVEFMHQPRMGECYLFAAAWLVLKK